MAGMAGTAMARGFEIAGFTFAAADGLKTTENQTIKQRPGLPKLARILIRAKRSSMVILWGI